MSVSTASKKERPSACPFVHEKPPSATTSDISWHMLEAMMTVPRFPDLTPTDPDEPIHYGIMDKPTANTRMGATSKQQQKTWPKASIRLVAIYRGQAHLGLL
ncbi:hypothetical protein PG990_004517 [Apiospora arundinis]